MENFHIKATLILLISIAVLVMAGLIIYGIVDPFPKKRGIADVKTDEITVQEEVSRSFLDTGTRQPHTIVIENVQNTQQLSEILNIIETYTRENEISNLKIECIKMEDMESSLAPASSDE